MNPKSLYQRWIWVIALALMVKAGMMAFFVTPPADIPDESGHYAYANDIANGVFFPILGKAEIPNNLWRNASATAVDTHRENYIAQHPPLYYTVAAIPLAVGKALKADKPLLARLTRLVSAVSLGLLVVAIFHLQIAAGLSARWSLVVAPWIAFVPMVSHLSSGITNDVFLFLVCAVATLYLVRYLQTGALQCAYACAFWLAAAGTTKMTAWILVAGGLGILLFELRGPALRWLRHAAGLSVVALSTVVWWVLRNIHYHGDALKISVVQKSVNAQVSRSTFLTEQPLVDWLFHHFYGLIGFSGYCQNERLAHLCHGARLTRIEGFPTAFFAYTVIAIALLIVLHSAWPRERLNVPAAAGPRSLANWLGQLLGLNTTLRTPIKLLLTLLGVLVFAAAAWSLQRTPDTVGLLALLSVSLLLALPLLGTPSLLQPSAPADRMVFYAGVLMAAAVLLIFNQAHKAYLITGMLKGVQGRYLYPFLPLMMAAWAYVLSRWTPLHKLLLPVTLILLVNETTAYLEQLIPFFLLVRI